MSIAIIDENTDQLTKMLNDHLTSDEQKIFLQSFAVYLNYGETDAKVVNFDDLWEWIGFSTKANGKRLLEKHLLFGKDYETMTITTTTKGRPVEKIMLSIDAFKKICILANTEQGEKVRSYYTQMEKVLMKYQKLRLEELASKNATMAIEFERKKKEIESHMQIKIDQIQEKSVYDQLMKHHYTLLNSYDNQRVVYCVIVEWFEDGSYILKIGSTYTLRDRITRIKADFHVKEVALLDVFPCENHVQFENHLHSHVPILQDLKYKEPVNNSYISSETYLIPNEATYKKVVRVIQKEILPFKSRNIEEKKLDIEGTRLQTEMKWADYSKEYCNMVTQLSITYRDNPEALTTILQGLSVKSMLEEVISNARNNEHDTPLNIHRSFVTQISTTSSAKPTILPKINKTGPVVQVYDGQDTSKLLHVFESITEALRGIQGATMTPIKLASQNKTLYMGYRWHLLPRSENYHDPKDIGPTTPTQVRNAGYIAMLSADGGQIEKVFPTQREAAQYATVTPSAMSMSLKFDRQAGGRKFAFWDNISTEIQQAYLASHKLPEISNKNGVKIAQLCATTGTLIKIHDSIEKAAKECTISPKTLKTAITSEEPYNNFLWRIMQ